MPQEDLDGLVVAYDRGKGIGGSSSINFCKSKDVNCSTYVLTVEKVSGIGVLEMISMK